jgi:hypothetical protein
LPLLGAGASTGGFGFLYHLTALSAVIGYVVIGLALARSRLRLSIMAYEMNPCSMVIGLMVFAPFVIGFVTAITAGYGGFLGLLGIAVVAARMDVAPKAPKWVPPPPPNMPPTAS